jgi:hypothetical protein
LSRGRNCEGNLLPLFQLEVAEALFQGVISGYRDRAAALLSSEAGAGTGERRLATGKSGADIVVSEIRSLAETAQAQLEIVPVLFSVLVERMVSKKSDLHERLGAAFAELAAAWAKILSGAGLEDPHVFTRTVVSMLDGIVLHAALFRGSSVDLKQASELLCSFVYSKTRGGIS